MTKTSDNKRRKRPTDTEVSEPPALLAKDQRSPASDEEAVFERQMKAERDRMEKYKEALAALAKS
jgi:hypothetical protein